MQKRVIGFDTSGGLPIMAMHYFATTGDGQLAHYIDGRLRATVPPEGWADYAKTWPESGDVIDSLIRPTTPAAPLFQIVEPDPVKAEADAATIADLKAQLAALGAS